MSLRTSPGWSGPTVAATAIGMLLVPLLAAPVEAQARQSGYRVTVMTRNLYLGADVQRPVRATAGKTGAEAVIALGNSTHEMRSIADRTRFRVRSELLAGEIAETRPGLVGLQEVALWRSGPLELPPPLGDATLGTLNSTTVDYDFLKILLRDLRREGVSYRAVSVQTGSDVEWPSFRGSPGTDSFASQRDVRLTMRNVILLRARSGLELVAQGRARFDSTLVLTVAGAPRAYVRGYTWADVRRGTARPFRFVNTHLEAFSSDIGLAQAKELLAEAASNRRKTTIIACDCNSDPLNHTVKPIDTLGTPHSGPYDFIRSGGFADMWLRRRPSTKGLTAALSETVDDTTRSGFRSRIDMLFSRTPSGRVLDVVRGQVTGDRLADRDPVTGLWPSDHAGVVLRLGGLGSR